MFSSIRNILKQTKIFFIKDLFEQTSDFTELRISLNEHTIKFNNRPVRKRTKLLENEP